MDTDRASGKHLFEEFRRNGGVRGPYKEIRKACRRLADAFSPATAGKNIVKVAVLGGFNCDYLTDYLRFFLFQREVAAEIAVAGYGQLVQEVLGTGPTLRTNPDVVVILPTHRDLRYRPRLGSTLDEALSAAESEAAFWLNLIKKVNRTTVFLSFDQPDCRPLGELTGFSPSGIGAHARRVNQLLFDRLPASASMIDAEALSARLGALWRDRYLYTLCKQPFAMEALPVVADTLAASVAAHLGKARKVLVFDLDNTLWGGVVGDVGTDGLELGPETSEGEAFSDIQRYAKALSERGVILALCSKNNEEIAWSSFKKHSAMVLREEDISAFTINFEDKATNIRNIAKTLNIGLQSVVFVDDNPVERDWVGRQLPEVAVVDLPDNPSRYIDAIEAENHFPLVGLTSEDLSRTRSYQAMSVLRQGEASAEDIDSFLIDLKSVAVVEPVTSFNTDRIVQLIYKTNQFKINAQVFDAEQIGRNARNVIALRLSDRLQDYGIVAVAVTRPVGDALEILNWVMSCRVFGRRLEHAMVELLWQSAQRAGATSLRLEFVGSGKNGIVPAFLQEIGFVQREQDRHFDLHHYRSSKPHHINIQKIEEDVECLV